MKEQHRLPNGKITKSMKVYLREWNKLKKLLEKELQLKTIGFDPGFIVYPEGGGRSVEIPTWLAIRIVESLNKK